MGLSGQKLLGVPILVQPSQAEKNRLAMAPTLMSSNSRPINVGPMRLYVGSLHFNITEEMLKGIFEPFGKVSNLFLFYVCFVDLWLYFIPVSNKLIHVIVVFIRLANTLVGHLSCMAKFLMLYICKLFCSIILYLPHFLAASTSTILYLFHWPRTGLGVRRSVQSKTCQLHFLAHFSSDHD